MTVQQMQDRVAFLVDDNSGKNYAPADVLISLNIGQDNVAKEFAALGQGWFETNSAFSTASGQELYDLPSDFISASRLERTDTGYPLHQIPMNEKLIAGSSNPPLINIVNFNYYITGNKVGINPVPQQVIPLQLWYVQFLPRLTLTTDVSQIPLNFHDMVCYSAAIDFVIKDEGNATQLLTRYNSYLMQLHQTQGSRMNQEPRSVSRVSGSYGY